LQRNPTAGAARAGCHASFTEPSEDVDQDVGPSSAWHAILPRGKSSNSVDQLKAQAQLRPQKNKEPARTDRRCVPKILSRVLRPRAKVQGGAKVQSVVSRSIVGKIHDALQSLVRDLARQDVPYFVPHWILHLCPSRAASGRITDER